MQTDIKLQTDCGRFKLRACPVLCIQGRFLIFNNEKAFFRFPGGHVELGETAEEATIREMLEETGLEAEIKDLICIMQNIQYFEPVKIFHEIAYYYTVTLKDKAAEKGLIEGFKKGEFSFEHTENDKGVIRHAVYHWMTLEELKASNFMPAAMLKSLEDLNKLTPITYKLTK